MLNNKIVKNASWIIGCKIAQSVISLVIGMITTRYLGPSNYGLINYASSLVSFVLPIAFLGFNNILVHESIKNPDEEGKIYGTALVMSICSSIACIVGLFCFAYFVNAGETDTIIVCFLYSLMLIFQSVELLQYWFQARYLSKFFSIITLLVYILVSIYKIFLLVTQKSIYWFALSNVFDCVLIAVGLMITYKKLGGKRLKFSFSTAKRLLDRSKHYIISNLMITIFAQTDRIMLKLMIGSSATGYYSAAVNCVVITSFIYSAIIDSMRPAVFEGLASSEERFKENIRRLYTIIIYLSLAQSLAFTLLAEPIINVLYGSAYSSSINALRLATWYSTFSYVGGVNSVWILAKEKQKHLWIINLSGASLNVVLNLCLIPIIGIYGAAIATIITQLFTNIIINVVIKPLRDINKIIVESIKPHTLIADFRILISSFAKRKKKD